MKVIINKWIPFKGFLAMNFFGLIFVRSEEAEFFDARVENHEAIHTAQMKELLWVFYYLLYILEWLFLLLRYRNSDKAYMNISFEKEVYNNETNFEYLKSRKHYSQWR